MESATTALLELNGHKAQVLRVNERTRARLARLLFQANQARATFEEALATAIEGLDLDPSERWQVNLDTGLLSKAEPAD